MTPVELSRTVLRAVRCAVDRGELSVAVPARAVVTVPGPGGSGDYATNIALQLARPAGRPPRQVAEILRPHLSRTEGVAAVEITGPGFLNIHLDRAAVTALVRRIQGAQGAQAPDHPHPPYGHSGTLAGQVVRLRIPYDIRAEVVADALVRIVASQSGRVEVDHVRPGRFEAAGGAGAPGKPGEPGDPNASDQPIDLRPVPAPEDPTPLGPDALRWALLHPAAHDRPRITADLLVQRASNPLFRVRYAHARARALTRNAAALGFTGEPGALDAPGDTTPLLAALTEYPHTLARAAADHAPDRLARQLVVIADALLALQHRVLPRGDEKPSAAHRARLALAEAAGTVLAGGLSLLGIDAPEYL
ncbi:ArgS-related anticodon-binding protein NrtL [Streptomyces tailanensis]|uniref:ArgS-related anticodon-binding protein NrtL n=1 Tax=Streptomyces tailanensis TaxID=2569858 RepID=UPI00155A7C92|nr:DALR anticodon-binding domain-containing protein [Streptomyces tailanensis]